MFPMFRAFLILASQIMGVFYFETFQSLQLTNIVLKMHVALKPIFILLGDNAFLRASETHCANVSLEATSLRCLLLQKSLYSQKCCLNGLKTATSNGCSACEVCARRVNKSKPAALASFTTSKVTWLLYPSRINKWRFSGEIPPRPLTLAIKCNIHIEKRYEVIHALCCISICSSGLILLHIILTKTLATKYVEIWDRGSGGTYAY